MKRRAFALPGFLLIAVCALAQQPATGFPPYGSFEDGRFDAVNRQNLNFNFAIPLVSSSGRGIDLNHSLVYDSLVWQKAFNTWYSVTDANGQPILGWKNVWPTGMISVNVYYPQCEYTGPSGGVEYETLTYYGYYAYVDPAGTRHPFSTVGFYAAPPVFCNPANFPTGPRTGDATDDSGYYLDATAPDSPIVWSPGGFRIESDGTLTDSNGNFINKVVVSSAETDWKDTVGRVALKIITSISSIQYKFLDQTGAYQTTTVNLLSFNINPNFRCPGVVDPTLTVNLPVSITLPNGRSYQFSYESTPNLPGYYTGRLQQVTLPTGGYYRYEYAATPNNGINCADGSYINLTRTINDGTSSAIRQFTRAQVFGPIWTTTVTAPILPYDSVGNDTVYTFNGVQETSQQIYQGKSDGTGTLLRTNNTIWAADGTPRDQITILEDGLTQSKRTTVLDPYGNLQQLLEYSWGQNQAGNLIRNTTFTYATLGFIRNRVASQTVQDGNGKIFSQTVMEYDGYGASPPFQGTNCITGATQHDDVGYSCSVAARGNLTKMTTYKNPDPNTPTGPVVDAFTYDSLGNLRSATDPVGHTTSFFYSDSFTDNVNRNTYAYVTQTTKPAPFSSQTISSTFYYPTGRHASVTDENSRTTSFSYLDAVNNPDPFNRLRKTAFPDGGQTTVAYDDINRTRTITQNLTPTSSISVAEVYNQLGLLTQRQLPGSRKVDISYDVFGRRWKVSNPYVNQTDPTAGVVETQYDALGRVKSIINQDSSSSQTQYKGNTSLVTDEAGRKRLTEMDALGRVTKICEVTSGNTRSPAEDCGNTSFPSTGYKTTVVYDVFDNVTQTAQGAQTRTSTYDAVGRLSSTRILEVTTATDVTYGYNDDGLRTSVTDPRGTVSFEYDELHRSKRKKYNGTVVAAYSYDGTTANNAVGRLIAEIDGDFGSGADETDYTYDAMGRVLSANRKVSGTTYAMSYAYDLIGNLTSLSYPSPGGTRRLIQYAYNSAGELNKVTDATNSLATFNYVASTVYSPLRPLSQLNLGNGVTTTLGRNNRGLLTSLLTQKTGSATLLNLAYGYFNNGKTQQITNALDSLKSEKYTYDDLNRLLSAQRGPDTNIQRKYQYDYDRYGNRWGQNLVAGSGYNGQLSFDTINNNNRVNSPGFGFDGSGNLTANATGVSFTYNAENFLATAGTATYNYDAQGRRVRKTVGGVVTDYFYAGSEIIAEKQGTNWTDYIFFGNQRIVQQVGATASTAMYLHPDYLGSTRVCTDANGLSNGTCDYEPFGEVQPGSFCSLPTNYRFAEMEWDANAQLYHTWFRQYDPTQGRWMSLDPLAGSAADPQSLDRYPYVGNDPVDFVDPLGLCRSLGCHESDEGVVCLFVCGGGDGGSTPQPEQSGPIGSGGTTDRGAGQSSLVQRIACAAQFGQSHSLAAGLGAVFGKGVGDNFVTQLFLGNSVSGLADFGLFISGNKDLTQGMAASIVLKGAAQGIPVPPGHPGLSGAVGQARSAIVQGAVNAGFNAIAGVGQETLELGITASGRVATAVAPLSQTALQKAANTAVLAKLAFDAVTFSVGLIKGCPK